MLFAAGGKNGEVNAERLSVGNLCFSESWLHWSVPGTVLKTTQVHVDKRDTEAPWVLGKVFLCRHETVFLEKSEELKHF